MKMIWEQTPWIFLSLVMALEDEYNIEIPSEELTDLNTVGDVIEYMKSKGIDA